MTSPPIIAVARAASEYQADWLSWILFHFYLLIIRQVTCGLPNAVNIQQAEYIFIYSPWAKILAMSMPAVSKFFIAECRPLCPTS